MWFSNCLSCQPFTSASESTSWLVSSKWRVAGYAHTDYTLRHPQNTEKYPPLSSFYSGGLGSFRSLGLSWPNRYSARKRRVERLIPDYFRSLCSRPQSASALPQSYQPVGFWGTMEIRGICRLCPNRSYNNVILSVLPTTVKVFLGAFSFWI